MIARIPVVPDPHTAHDLLRRILAGAEYQRAKPSLLEYLWAWLQSLFTGIRLPSSPNGPPLFLLVLPLVLLGLGVLAAFLVYGVPRLQHRRRLAGAVFDDDDRDVDALRRAASTAARAGDWSTAVVEQFRAITRALADRTVVSISPGTTAHGVARNASAVFPASAAELDRGADVFDLVRYLDGTGTRDDWERLVALDRELAASRPELDRTPYAAAPR